MSTEPAARFLSASGGYTAGRKEIIDYLRQRSRPYLFSNTLAPVVAATSLKALELVASRPDLRAQLARNTRRFRDGMAREGFRITPGEHRARFTDVGR